MKKSAIMRDSIISLKKVVDKNCIYNQAYKSFYLNSPTLIVSYAYLNNEKYIGFGIDHDRNKAAFKSFMELYERVSLSFVLKKNKNLYKRIGSKDLFEIEQIEKMYGINSQKFIKNTSNGFAIHTLDEKSLESSIDESIERHVILKMLAQKLVPQIYKSSYLDILPGPQYNLIPHLYLVNGPLERKVIICRLSKKGMCVYGFGSSSDIDRSCLQAIKEASIKSYFLIEENDVQRKSYIRNHHFRRHMESKLHEANGIFDMAERNNKQLYIDQDFKPEDFFYSVNYLDEVLPGNNHLVLSRSFSPLLQPLFYGPWTKNNLNKLAINSDSLPKEWHIIG